MFQGFYNFIICIGSNLQSLYLLIVRIWWGFAFYQTGMGKFGNLERVGEFFSSLGIPYPDFNAYLVASVESVCGLLLVFGFASRLAAIPLIITMVTAYFTAHYDAVAAILENPQGFAEQAPFTFLFASLLVFIFGPGRVSVDAFLKRYVFKKT